MGASLTALTVTLRLWLSTLTLGAVLDPLSVTVQVMLPIPFASATVLYFRPSISASVKPVAPVVTDVVPSVFHRVTKLGMLVIAYVRVWLDSSLPPPGP